MRAAFEDRYMRCDINLLQVSPCIDCDNGRNAMARMDTEPSPVLPRLVSLHCYLVEMHTVTQTSNAYVRGWKFADDIVPNAQW